MAHLKGKGHPDRPITTLHDVVTDYLNTQAYASTARALALPRTWKRSDATSLAVAGIGHDATSVNGTGGSSDAVNGNGNDVKAGEIDGSGDVAMEEDTNGADEADEEEPVGGVLSEKGLVAMERRRAILNYILNGAIMRAVDMLNAHFPSVLASPPSDESNSQLNASGSTTNGNGNGPSKNGHITPSSHTPQSYPYSFFNSLHSPFYYGPQPPHNLAPSLNIPLPPPPPIAEAHALPSLPHSLHPSHVHLNLSIQAFIELVRQLAPTSVPSSPSSSIGSLSSSMHLPSASGLALTNALNALQGLHQEAKRLLPADRAVYLKELNDVNGLLAYTDPESSIVRGFLEQGRRIVLAEQVNRAILHSENRQTHSKLEHTARRVTALWAIMAERKIDPTPNWTAADGAGKEELALYLRSHPKRTFSLREFVGHSSA